MFSSPSGRKTFVVTCKQCRRDVPSGREEFPFQSVAVECPLCGELRRYLPSEVSSPFGLWNGAFQLYTDRMDNKIIDRYTLELEAPNEPVDKGSPIRCIATNMSDNSTAEAWLSLMQTNALLSFLYGKEVNIVDNFMQQLSDHRYAELIAHRGGE
jgi:hypothetical protein